VTVRIQGARELRRNINRMQDAVDTQAAKADMKAAHLQGAAIVRDVAVTLVPIQLGRLRDTIRASGTIKSGRVRAGFVRVPYAGPIHFGWPARGIKPQPFLYDALDRRRSEVMANYERSIADIVKKYDL
jgi:hypothetical protein